METNSPMSKRVERAIVITGGVFFAGMVGGIGGLITGSVADSISGHSEEAREWEGGFDLFQALENYDDHLQGIIDSSYEVETQYKVAYDQLQVSNEEVAAIEGSCKALIDTYLTGELSGIEDSEQANDGEDMALRFSDGEIVDLIVSEPAQQCGTSPAETLVMIDTVRENNNLTAQYESVDLNAVAAERNDAIEKLERDIALQQKDEEHNGRSLGLIIGALGGSILGAGITIVKTRNF